MKKVFTLIVIFTLFLGLNACTNKVDRTLPDLTGLTKTEALKELASLNLMVTVTDILDNTVNEGIFLYYGNNYQVGDILEPFTPITIYFAINQDLLPDLSGYNISEIISKFRSLGVILEFRYEETNAILDGLFVSYGDNQSIGDVITENMDVVVILAKNYIETEYDLMISAYLEGSYTNRAIELYNITDHVVDLSKYSIGLYLDGSSTKTTNITLNGLLEPLSTYVISYTDSSEEILNMADFVTNELIFNGNDTITLDFYNGTTIDQLGNIGWGLATLMDITLIRDLSVSAPTTNYLKSEWNQYAKDYMGALGNYPISYPTTFTFDNQYLALPFSEPTGVAVVSFVSVYDGDTAYFTPGFTGANRVRFVGIDTTEMGSGTLANQAKQFVYSKLSTATTIYIQYDPSAGNEDTYGRSLGLVWYDGKLLNYEMVLNGYSQNNYADEQQLLVFNNIPLMVWFQRAEAYAKANHLGLWG